MFLPSDRLVVTLYPYTTPFYFNSPVSSLVRLKYTSLSFTYYLIPDPSPCPIRVDTGK